MTTPRLRLRDFPALVNLRREARERERLMGAPDLTYLFWESTLRCNLRCRHCGSGCEADTPLRELTTAEVKGILDTIAEDFDARRIFVSITGGEPLLRKDLCEVVAHMTQLGMESCIVTNGTLLGADEVAALVAAGMRTVSISVDGLQDTHDAVRGEGSFQRALRGIACAAIGGMEVVEAITCVRPANLGQLREIEQAVRRAGANLWRCITIDRMGRLEGGADPEFWLEPPQIRRLFDFLEGRRAAQQRLGLPEDVSFSCGGFVGVRREDAVRPRHNQCSAGLVVGSILCDGQVGACPSLPRSWAQGSALETRFSKIWYERFQDYRSHAVRRQGPCADCAWYGVCLGGGLHERLAQPDDFCWLARQ